MTVTKLISSNCRHFWRVEYLRKISAFFSLVLVGDILQKKSNEGEFLKSSWISGSHKFNQVLKRRWREALHERRRLRHYTSVDIAWSAYFTKLAYTKVNIYEICSIAISLSCLFTKSKKSNLSFTSSISLWRRYGGEDMKNRTLQIHITRTSEGLIVLHPSRIPYSVLSKGNFDLMGSDHLIRLRQLQSDGQTDRRTDGQTDNIIQRILM